MTQVQLKRSYEKKIKKIVSVLKIVNPQKIILFGSVAWGRIYSDSDIDICVIKETKDRWKLKSRLRNIIWEKNIGFEPEIDIHVYPPSVYYDWLNRHDPFIEEIEKGRTLYEQRQI